MDTKLLLLCHIYLKDKDNLYLPDFDPLWHTGLWLELIEAEEFQDRHTRKRSPRFPMELAPDICMGCLTSFGPTIGGRVRQRCIYCYPLKPYFLHPWEYKLKEILGLNSEYFDYHLAIALDQIRRPKRRQEDPFYGATEIQPNVQTDPRTDRQGTRRFNFLTK